TNGKLHEIRSYGQCPTFWTSSRGRGFPRDRVWTTSLCVDHINIARHFGPAPAGVVFCGVACGPHQPPITDMLNSRHSVARKATDSDRRVKEFTTSHDSAQRRMSR